MGLGGIFGGRLLLLEHIGRSSGVARHVMLEVVDRPAAGGYVVASGFGMKAQWFRNILANPHVRFIVGSHRIAGAVARVMSAEEARTVLRNYALRQPKAWNSLKPVFEEALGAQISEDGTNLPMVLITPTEKSGRAG
jgi:deazaflavin-dependent oxidoreductase (nitroreductase family)